MRKLLLELIPRCFGTVRNLQLMTINKRRASVGPRIIAFISYSNEDRKYGAQAKSVVAEIRIEAFLAHDDPHVSDEWRKRIIEELGRCDLFVPLFELKFSDVQMGAAASESTRGLRAV
jgi:hypothetical protein